MVVDGLRRSQSDFNAARWRNKADIDRVHAGIVSGLHHGDTEYVVQRGAYDTCVEGKSGGGNEDATGRHGLGGRSVVSPTRTDHPHTCRTRGVLVFIESDH